MPLILRGGALQLQDIILGDISPSGMISFHSWLKSLLVSLALGSITFLRHFNSTGKLTGMPAAIHTSGVRGGSGQEFTLSKRVLGKFWWMGRTELLDRLRKLNHWQGRMMKMRQGGIQEAVTLRRRRYNLDHR